MADTCSTRILPVANADNIMSCRALQADYAELQQKYTDLKEKKIQGLDGMLEEHSAKLAAHNETAVKLADHWRQEAHRQAAFAQAAGAPAMQVRFLQVLFENKHLRFHVIRTNQKLNISVSDASETRHYGWSSLSGCLC